MQRELLNSIINKTMFAILIEQQKILSQIGFPRFNLQFVDALQNFIENRKSIPAGPGAGTGAGAATQKASVEFEYSTAIVETLSWQRRLVCGFLSLRMAAVSEERSRLQAAANRMRVATRAGGNHELYSSTSNRPPRINSVTANAAAAAVNGTEDRELTPVSPASSEDASGFDSDPQAADSADYYSMEAKKKRRKRRLNVQTQDFGGNGDEEMNSYDSSNHSYHGGSEWTEGNQSRFANSVQNNYTNNNAVYNNRYSSGGGGTGGGFSYNNSSNREVDRANYLHPHEQQPHGQQDALKLPLLHKLAVMLKHQGQGHTSQRLRS